LFLAPNLSIVQGIEILFCLKRLTARRYIVGRGHRSARTARSSRSKRLLYLLLFNLGDSMRSIVRSYATITKATPRLHSRGKSLLSLDHFIQRQRVLALWRDIVRSTASIKDETTRNEMRSVARDEFKRHRHVRDIDHIRYLLSVRHTDYTYIYQYILMQSLIEGKD
jgi:hypothetical protein